jgi:predicted secreted protein
MATDKTTKVLDGTDLILSVGGSALSYSTGCKITTTTETGERVTKEKSAGKWKEKYVKSYSEEISADGCVLTDGSGMSTYDTLKQLQLAGEPVDASYGVRDSSATHSGKYLITSLDLDGQAGDDAKYSIKLENTGAVSDGSSQS